MIPEIFQSSEPRELGIWVPVIGLIILFLGMNMRIEVKVQKEEEEK